jgi:cytochrome c2
VNLDELDEMIESQHARAAERIGRPATQGCATCHGREPDAKTEYGENQRHCAARRSARRPVGEQRTGCQRSWAP